MPQESTSSSSSLVTIFDPTDENVKNLRDHEIISLSHPGLQEESDYLLLKTCLNDDQHYHIYELQSLESKYGSYFIGSHVLKNGTLHMATRVDPLFFVLDSLSSVTTNQKWQPLEQLEIPDTIQKCVVDKKHYRHVCSVNDQLGDDMLLYKLNEEKVLKWLTKKQQRVLEQMKTEVLSGSSSNPKSTAPASAKSAGFNLVEDDPPPVAAVAGVSAEETTQVLHDSIQVVCDYLSPTWQSKFIKHLGVSESLILEPQEKKSTKRTWEEVDTSDMHVVSVEKKKKPAAQSLGLKKLQKVSTKGMKSLSSFFGGKKK